MKKILTITLSVMILLSIAACGNNAEIERLRKENAELKKQISVTATEKPVSKSKIELVEQIKTDSASSDYIHANFTVKNTSGKDINTLSLDIKELDEKGNIISTTHPQEGVIISPGQNVTISAITKATTYALQLDSYSYYEGSERNNFVQGQFNQDIDKLVLK